jgi:hypothetical protein
MPEPQSSLWPGDFGTIDKETPVSILRTQGTALGEQTKNIVVGRIFTDGLSGGQFRHRFLLYCSPLGFEIELLRVEHGIDLYPAVVGVPKESGNGFSCVTCQDTDALKRALREVFASPKTTRMIASLLVQSPQ